MIRCPNCGTINRDGRRSCRECGNALPQTKLRCPECGALNAVGNLFCDKCNARLISPEDVVPSNAEAETVSDASPVKGISLPTRSMDDDNDEDTSLPDWLLELADDETTPAQSEPGASEGDEEAGYPDWISGLVDEEAFEGEDEKAAPEQAREQDAFALDDGDLPDWLQDVEEPAEALQTEPAQADASQAEEPEADSAAFSLEGEDLPDWLRDVEEPEEQPQEEEEPVSEAEAPAQDWDIPDWLAEHAAPSLMEGREAPEQTLPDWLAERAEEIPVSSASSSQEIPEWLQASAEPSPPREEETVTSPPPAEDAFDLDTEGLPDWLSEELEETEPAPGPQPVTEAQEAPKTQTAPVDDTGTAEEDLPDWLRDVGEDFEFDVPGSEEPEAVADTEEPRPEPQTAPQMPAEPTAAPSEQETEAVPDWLADIEMTDEVDVEAATDVFAGEPEPAPSADEPEVEVPEEAPEWLRDIAPSERPPEPQQGTPALVGAEGAEEEPEEETPAIEAAEPEEIPDWLMDLEPAAPEQQEGPAQDPAPASPDEQEEPRPARANLPAWMQGLRPPDGTGEGDEMQPFTEAAEAEGLVPAEIPDWVRALRPELEAGGAESSRAERIQKTASVEMEGPLSSLRGVLAETTIVDIPTDMDVSVTAAIPEDVKEQAELWQELLSRPRSVERSVTQAKRRGSPGTMAVRLLLTALLFVGALTGLWFLTPALRISQTPSPQNAPGVGMFWSQLEQLQAGDTVLVAVEYGPAYADEMNAMAEAMFEHLRDREVTFTLVSTLPEGTGLPQAAVMDVYGDEDPVDQRAYLVNQLPGVASYLQSPDAQAAEQLVILASRPTRVRWWIEQNAALQGVAGAAPLPVSVAASASSGPLIAPYLEQTTVAGWVIGLPQTLAYRELRGLDNAAYGGIPDVLMLTHWIVAGFLFFGMLYHLALGHKGRGKKGAG